MTEVHFKFNKSIRVWPGILLLNAGKQDAPHPAVVSNVNLGLGRGERGTCLICHL